MAEFHHLIESLDCLWFFSTVFDDYPSSSIIPTAAEKPAHHQLEEPEKKQSNDSVFPVEETVKPPPPPAEEEVRVDLVVFVSKPETASERRKRLARRWRSKNNKTIILLELDLCFDNFYYYSGLYGLPVMSQQTARRKKMPPLNDSLEMKRKIKSWAHAVACTVK